MTVRHTYSDDHVRKKIIFHFRSHCVSIITLINHHRHDFTQIFLILLAWLDLCCCCVNCCCLFLMMLILSRIIDLFIIKALIFPFTLLQTFSKDCVRKSVNKFIAVINMNLMMMIIIILLTRWFNFPVYCRLSSVMRRKHILP